MNKHFNVIFSFVLILISLFSGIIFGSLFTETAGPFILGIGNIIAAVFSVRAITYDKMNFGGTILLLANILFVVMALVIIFPSVA